MDHHFFLTRHASPARDATDDNPVSADFPDLTDKGVAQALSRGRQDIAKLIESAPSGSLVVIAGASDQPRTKHTALLLGEGLQQALGTGDLKDTVLLTRKSVEALAQGKGFSTMGEMKKILETNPSKKIVIDYPLMLKEWCHTDRWLDESGKNKTPYATELFKKHNNNHQAAGMDWLENGRLTLADGKILEGPKPLEIAESYLHGLQRLHTFVQRHADGRPIVIVGVGHQWDLDMLITYLANNGVVDMHGFKKVTGGTFFQETEPAEIVIGDTGITVHYRGKMFEVPVRDKN